MLNKENTEISDCRSYQLYQSWSDFDTSIGNCSDTAENAGIGIGEYWSPGTDPIPRNLLN